MDKEEESVQTKFYQSSMGLTKEEVEKRIQQYGRNVVSEAQPRMILSLLRKFWGVVPWMLEFAAIIAWFTGNVVEAILIVVLLVLRKFLQNQ